MLVQYPGNLDSILTIGVLAFDDRPDLGKNWQCDFSDHCMTGCLAGPGIRTRSDTSEV